MQPNPPSEDLHEQEPACRYELRDAPVSSFDVFVMPEGDSPTFLVLGMSDIEETSTPTFILTVVPGADGSVLTTLESRFDFNNTHSLMATAGDCLKDFLNRAIEQQESRDGQAE